MSPFRASPGFTETWRHFGFAVEDGGLQKPRAFVVLREDASVDAAALQQHVKTTLSPQKYPRDVRFLAELPRTGSGKIDRRALRNLKRDSPSLDSEATA